MTRATELTETVVVSTCRAGGVTSHSSMPSLHCIALAAATVCGCGTATGEIVAASEQAVRGRSACVVDPNPVLLGDTLTISISGMPRSTQVTVLIQDAAGAHVDQVVSDHDGRLNVTRGAVVTGEALVDVSVQHKKGPRVLARCSYEVIEEPVCDDGFCDDSEDCASCPTDCGQCISCGDGTCQTSEDCATCPTDCGECVSCGDSSCDPSEDCSSCPADCGACVACGDGTCQASEDCATCPTDCGECSTSNFPPQLDVALSSSLIAGSGGAWTEAATRSYVTQSRLAYLNGGFGTDTAECGLQGPVIKVTNLNDDGPGSLRVALENSGKRTVVFEVSGSIHLESRLSITNPYLTLAGQTAPAPGIALYHQGVRVRTHDVCIQHVRIRLGDRLADGSLRSDFNVADTMSIGYGGEPIYNVVIDNVSLSWSLDEILDVGGEGIDGVTVRDSLITEPLLGTNGHAYCTMLSDYGANQQRFSYIANVLAHCYRRNPRLGEGTNVVVNHFIYNPGRHAIHISGNSNTGDLWTSIVGNAMAFPTDPADQYDGYRSAFALIENVYQHEPRTARVYLAGNHVPEGYAIYRDFYKTSSPGTLVDAAEVWDSTIYPMHGSDIEAVLLPSVGAFPKHRDVVDTRVIDDIRNRRGTFIGSQDDVGGYPELPQHSHVLAVPSEPQGDDDGDGISNLVEWLQEFTNAVE